jgi:potassium-transporting ATPase KdpC subunit
MRLPRWLSQHLAALRALLVLTAILGLAYPLAMVGIGRLPFLEGRSANLIGQSFTDADGNPVPRYFQSRPSAAGEHGYDPTATAASNLGPESLVLLNQVCERSKAVGELEGVDGRRPFCTADGVGAVLAVLRRDGFTGPRSRPTR